VEWSNCNEVIRHSLFYYLYHYLDAKAVNSFALSFEGINNIHCKDCLPICVLSIGYGVLDQVHKKSS
jgi:hypothetical protein